MTPLPRSPHPGPHSSRRSLSAIPFFIAWVLVVWAAVPLHERWREESRDRRVALAVEWNEFRDFNARLAPSTVQLLNDLRTRGVTALVIAPITLEDLLLQHRVQPLGSSFGSGPLDVPRLRVNDPALARQLGVQWALRNIPDLQARAEGKTTVFSRRQGSFAALRDSDVGFDPLLMDQVRAVGLTPVLRIVNDPWLPEARFAEWLAGLPAVYPRLGVLFSSDDIAGGTANGPLWRSWMARHGVTSFLTEFRPAPSAWQMAYALPATTFRLHSIPAAELKDLKPAQEVARWQRAVEERSCRLLLLRMAPSDSRESFLRSITTLSNVLKRRDWRASFPAPRLTWRPVTLFQRWASPLFAFVIVCITPWLAMRWARSAFPRWRTSFWRIAGVCLVGAWVAAAMAQTPYTRVQVIPFRGVKWAFLISWALAVLSLYEWDELRWTFYQVVRRRDVLIAGLAAAAVGYLVLRTGNAPAAWKPSWEQSLRDLLETALVARPRFKEFAIGHPALWVGCYLHSLYRQRHILWDGRVLIGVGMIGPISMINTFCHLHSPLVLEAWRSFNGLALGVLLGAVGVGFLRRRLSSRPQISFPFAQEKESWFYQRTS